MKKWPAATVLVTGVTGFLGGWLVRSLLDRGARVIAVIRAPRPESQFFIDGADRDVQIEWGSVYDPGLLHGLLRTHRPDYFFHAAYGADVNRVLAEPLECFRSSVESTWLALDAIRQSETGTVSVIVSSDKAYGSQELPYHEDKPLTTPAQNYVAFARVNVI